MDVKCAENQKLLLASLTKKYATFFTKTMANMNKLFIVFSYINREM